MENLTEREKLIYFAGLLDGEGCIKMCSHGDGKRPIIQLQMTCEKTVKLFADYFGLILRELKSPSRLIKKHWKQVYHTRAECQKAYPIIKILYPFLTTKKEDAKICLDYYDNRHCLICEKSLPHTLNKKAKFCSAACRQKDKRKRGIQ